MPHLVGVDVGGTTSTIAVGDENRDVVFVSEQFDTRSSAGPRSLIDTVTEMIWDGISRCGGEAATTKSVGLSTPGPATPDGILLKAPNLDPELWNRFPIRRELETALRQVSPELNLHYIGDGQAAALGEYAIRTCSLTRADKPKAQPACAELSSLFMAIVGTGLGGGQVYHGEVVRGKEGRAGHVGHTLLPEFAFRYEHDRQLLVGNALCTAESAVSLTALTHQLEYRLSLDRWRSHPLNGEAGSIRDKAKRLRNLAGAGDPLALELFDDQANALGIALLSVNYLGDFDLLVIGGGVCDLSAEVRERYRQTAEDSYRRYALDGFRNLHRFEFSVCGDDAPVIGALAHAYACD